MATLRPHRWEIPISGPNRASLDRTIYLLLSEEYIRCGVIHQQDHMQLTCGFRTLWTQVLYIHRL